MKICIMVLMGSILFIHKPLLCMKNNSIIEGYSQSIQTAEIVTIRQELFERKAIEIYRITLANGSDATLTKKNTTVTCTLRPLNSDVEYPIAALNFNVVKKHYNAKLAYITELQRGKQLELTLRRRSYLNDDNETTDISEWVLVDDDKNAFK